jgi:hypothetical protein
MMNGVCLQEPAMHTSSLIPHLARLARACLRAWALRQPLARGRR